MVLVVQYLVVPVPLDAVQNILLQLVSAGQGHVAAELRVDHRVVPVVQHFETGADCGKIQSLSGQFVFSS